MGQYQHKILDLPALDKTRYENIFRLYTTNKKQYYYNLLQTINIDQGIDPKKLFYMTVKEALPWSIVSYNAYGTMDLWWLIALVNNIDNPVKELSSGTTLKIIRPQFIDDVLTEINNALQT